LGNDYEVFAGFDSVGNAGGHDRQDVGSALRTGVFPHEEPVPAPQDELSKLALAAIVRQRDVAVVQKY
jgi:hypothetical protein